LETLGHYLGHFEKGKSAASFSHVAERKGANGTEKISETFKIENPSWSELFECGRLLPFTILRLLIG